MEELDNREILRRVSFLHNFENCCNLHHSNWFVKKNAVPSSRWLRTFGLVKGHVDYINFFDYSWYVTRIINASILIISHWLNILSKKWTRSELFSTPKNLCPLFDISSLNSNQYEGNELTIAARFVLCQGKKMAFLLEFFPTIDVTFFIRKRRSPSKDWIWKACCS